jgi:hypothetical protein
MMPSVLKPSVNYGGLKALSALSASLNMSSSEALMKLNLCDNGIGARLVTNTSMT